jgi:hypothetical protein
MMFEGEFEAILKLQESSNFTGEHVFKLEPTTAKP